MAISSPPRPSGQAQPRPPSRPALVVALVVSLTAVLVLAGVVVALLARGSSPFTGLRGSGVAASQTRDLPAFAGVNLTGSNKVIVTVGGRQSVVVHADSNLVKHVTTKVEAGTLLIGTTGSFTTRSPMTVDVTVPALTALTLSGSGQISVTGVQARQLTVLLPGSGLLTGSGTVTRLDVSLSGSGLAQLTGLEARDVHAVVSGSGLIRVTATHILNAIVSGTGAINYSGNPAQVNRDVTGTGAITPG